MIKVKDRPKFGGVFVKPLICTAAMAVVAYFVYALVNKIGTGILGSGRFAVVVFLAAAIVIAAIAYLVLIIVTRTITMDDMKLVPKGEKLAKILRIR
jgi:stage V sporulation protein B